MARKPSAYDVPLFDLSEAPVSAPRKAKGGTASAYYTKYSAAKPQQCEDCAQLSYEQLCDGHLSTPGIRRAKFRCTQGSSVTFLCAAHKKLRELNGE